jgi:uncharacterized membrane protein (UPF0127 family)
MNFRLCNLIFFFAVFTLGVSACTSQKLKTAALVIESESGAVKINVEIAKTDEERSQGLMFRKKLPDGEGMLFVFERDQQLSFWMKNTLIPLSIAFIASDGRITEIKDMQPLNENTVKSSRSVRYALETPQGWFSRAGIQPGDRVNINF